MKSYPSSGEAWEAEVSRVMASKAAIDAIENPFLRRETLKPYALGELIEGAIYAAESDKRPDIAIVLKALRYAIGSGTHKASKLLLSKVLTAAKGFLLARGIPFVSNTKGRPRAAKIRLLIAECQKIHDMIAGEPKLLDCPVDIRLLVGPERQATLAGAGEFRTYAVEVFAGGLIGAATALGIVADDTVRPPKGAVEKLAISLAERFERRKTTPHLLAQDVLVAMGVSSNDAEHWIENALKKM